jgi:catechol 2,3-dioxygenase-like lactoylglutathione lyase family enzyme
LGTVNNVLEEEPIMSSTQTLRGFATISYWADDMEAAKKWYTELLGIAPYFERSGMDGKLAYAEFRVGDYKNELDLIDRRSAPVGAASGRWPIRPSLTWPPEDRILV